MLSFEKVTNKDIVVAWIMRDEHAMRPMKMLYFTPIFDKSADSQIVNDDILGLLKTEEFRLRRIHGLTQEEYQHIVRDIQASAPINPDFSVGMKKAFLEIQNLVSHKLKREFVLDRSEKAILRFPYDTSVPRTNYILGVFSSSGGGKSTFINNTLCRDPALIHYPQVRIIGTVGGSDPAYDDLREKIPERIEFLDTAEMDVNDFNIRRIEKGTVIVLDDSDAGR